MFVPAADAPAIPPGKEVTLAAAAVPSAVYGTLHGTVASVGNFPETSGSLQAFLGQDASVGSYLAAGSVIRVVIKLATVAGAPAELAWSRAGPGFALNAESSVQASFVVAAQHPIELADRPMSAAAKAQPRRRARRARTSRPGAASAPRP